MKTIIELFEHTVEKYGDNPFIWDKPNGGEYAPVSYREAHSKVITLAKKLQEQGIEKGDRVALLSEGREEWILSELAVLYAGAICVPLSIKLEEDELFFRLEHAECKAIFISERQFPKVQNSIKKLQNLGTIILFDEMEEIIISAIQYQDLISSLIAPKDFQIPTHTADDFVNISYTSGTTDDPKGIILTHKNYIANVMQSLSLFEVPPHYKTLLVLPWDHSFAHTVGIYTLIAGGASIAAVERGKTANEALRNIPKNIKEIEPTFLLSVPALAKNFRSSIETAIRKKGGMAQKMYEKGLKIAYKYNREGFNKGQGIPFHYKFLYQFYDVMVFKKIRKNFGKNLKFFVGGGALLNIELQRYFYALGIPMLQGYGLSEAAPVISSNNSANIKMGSSGKLVPNLEIKICNEQGIELPKGEQGEIVIRGDNVMHGYWKNDEASKEALKDGWLHTGDLGYLDEDNFLYVLGRYKSLLIGNDGEKYSPEGIETSIVSNSKFIEQCMLYNNQDPYTVGLIFPNKAAISRELEAKGYKLNTKEAAEKSMQILHSEISKFREKGQFANMFPNRWVPSALAVIPEGFSEQNKMLNSTMKMVRRKITERYNDKIKHLYTPEGKNLSNEENIETISKIIK